MPISLKSLDVQKIDDNNERELRDRLFMLKEELEYTLSNLDESNFTKRFYDELTVTVSEKATITAMSGLDVAGIVTFKALAENEQTVINGARIKTGIIEASEFNTFTYPEAPTNPNGEIKFFYKQYADEDDTNALLAGGLKMDGLGAGANEEAAFRVFLYTETISNSKFNVALKLQSDNNITFEAENSIYIASTGNNGAAVISITEDAIEISADYIKITGDVNKNGEQL